MSKLFSALFLLAICSTGMLCAETIDTVYVDDGTSTQSNPIRQSWEESVILSPQAPCTLQAVQIYYATAGTDTVRITGDAAEGTIPPTQYCMQYNTLGFVVHTVTAPGWVTLDLRDRNIHLGGLDRVVVQHVLGTGVAVWGQDAGQNPVTSFVYDALTPNPDFFNIPGIFYRAGGDYLVRLVVKYENIVQPPPTWTDVTDLVGIVDGQGARRRSDLASVADVNGDNWDDISIGNTLYRNSRNQGPFTAQTLPFTCANVVWADIDNDGDLDAFAVNGNGADGLWRNDGDTDADGMIEFTNMTSASGYQNNAPTVTPLFLDYDRDGHLDLFVANGRREVGGQETYFQDRLFRNNGNWTFTDVTIASGIAAGEPAPFHDTWGASLADVNNDGYPDIFVATYRLAPDRLYINNTNGTFTESSAATGAIGIPTAASGYYGHGMGSDWADIDNDGDLDLAVGNLGHPDQRGMYSNPSLILRNVGTSANPRYENWDSMSAQGIRTWHGVAFREMNAGMCFGDFDHDGLQDLYHGQISYELYGAGATRPARFYLQGADRFVDVTWQTGLFIHGSWTGCRIDFDRDGDLDLLAASGRHEVRLFRNDLYKRGSSITLRLKNGTTKPWKMLDGSRLTVHTPQGTVIRQLPGTVIGGRCSQNTSVLHVGLGAASHIDSIVVSWPDSTTTAFADSMLMPNGSYELYSNGDIGLQTMLSAPQQVLPPQHAIGVAARPTLTATHARYPMRFYISDVPDFTTRPALFEVESTSGEATLPEDLVEGKTYFWMVRYHDVYSGPASSIWQFTVGAPQPNTPSILQPEESSVVSTRTVVTWNRATYDSWQQPAVVYDVRIYRADDRTIAAQADALTDTTVTFELDSSSTYVATVRARADGATETAWSADRPFRTYGLPPAIALALPANGAVNQPIRPRLTWQEHAWADGGYEVQYGLADDFSDAVSKDRPTTEYRIVSALKTGRTYYWRVRGKNHVGPGQWSPTWSFTVEGTVGVGEESDVPRVIEHVIAYDVLGRIAFEGSLSEWRTLDRRQYLLAVGCTATGTVVVLR